jgi:excinuclease ABC subunit C
MAVRSFDRKFGAEFLASLPASPGVYLVYDHNSDLIYVGKAINLKRRLSQYRTTIRRKKYHRMRGIVKDAARIEIRCSDTHLDACLTETMLIQKHRPRWNIVGAYSFLYPLIGIRSVSGDTEFCMTTTPADILQGFPGFEFHGAFRSRRITGDAFFALMRLLKFIGHINPSNHRKRIPKYSYVVSFRKLPPKWHGNWAAFFKGESARAMEELILALVESAGARRTAGKTQEYLDELRRFWRREALPLARARRATGHTEWPISQEKRDLVFVSYRDSISRSTPAPTLN